MPHCLSTTICVPSIGKLGRGTPSNKILRSRYAPFCYSMRSDSSQTPLTVIRQPLTSIHPLDDDSLLNIFHFCRSNVLEEDEDGAIWLVKLVGEC